ncbi:MAG: Lrp/AsnC family transcriptional regulator [Gammaproteobacteria bacterium]|nr:Lrp/AsnC family transcriptional regulator [Gammaproteobacteria bacterium]MDE0225523.1 Lrp/AsnC family transcriptional regulator [Gammaproteobacteria bacterium]MDE0451194.1 Lrp/AsnC family transcriptional regulator [Gammaproteobacteria bacterium]
MALDRVERQILTELQRQGRLPNVELADRVGLSESPCFRRVKNLERDGVIQGYAARVDQRALGLTVTAYVHLTLEKGLEQRTDFHRRVQDEPHIVECHAMSGTHDYLMKVVARDMDHFSELVMRDILGYPGVSNLESSFSLSEIKQSGPLPVEA